MLGVGGHDQTLVELTGTFTAKQVGHRAASRSSCGFSPKIISPIASACIRRRTPSTCSTPSSTPFGLPSNSAVGTARRSTCAIVNCSCTKPTNSCASYRPRNSISRRIARQIENQAAAERGNSRRLANLSTSGQRPAARGGAESRNQRRQFGSLGPDARQILKDISGNRMPSVADLLKQASAAPIAVNAQPGQENGRPNRQARTAPPVASPGKKAETDPNAPPAPVRRHWSIPNRRSSLRLKPSPTMARSRKNHPAMRCGCRSPR